MVKLSDYNHLKNWNSADSALGDKNKKTIGNNTKLRRLGNGDIVVELHGNRVVRYNRDGSTQISSAGYHTSTTKDRINRYTPSNVRVVQRDYDWYVTGVSSEKVPFDDGMTI